MKEKQMIDMALDIIEGVTKRHLEDQIPFGNFEYAVWAIKVRYFG